MGSTHTIRFRDKLQREICVLEASNTYRAEEAHLKENNTDTDHKILLVVIKQNVINM